MKMKRSVLLTIAACLGLSTTTLYSADPPDSWNKNCTICHGKDGKGKTKAGLKAKVKDLTDAKYQESFSDDKAFKSIKEGIVEDGKKKMKPYGDKLSDKEIKELVAFVRTLKG